MHCKSVHIIFISDCFIYNAIYIYFCQYFNLPEQDLIFFQCYLLNIAFAFHSYIFGLSVSDNKYSLHSFTRLTLFKACISYQIVWIFIVMLIILLQLFHSRCSTFLLQINLFFLTYFLCILKLGTVIRVHECALLIFKKIMEKKSTQMSVFEAEL